MANIQVCVRFRPQNGKEVAKGGRDCVWPAKGLESSEGNECFTFKDEKAGESSFTFDQVFYAQALQATVFDYVAFPVVQDVMKGVNGTILAYGQTAAGKTHTMEGPGMLMDDPKLKGILPRVARAIFECIHNADDCIEFLVKLSMVEIYMERIRDLFDTRRDNLQVKEDKVRGIFVAGATETYVQSAEEMLQLLQVGVRNRAVGATSMNAGSSRSHCIFILTVQQTNTDDCSVKTGKLYLADLAGSEKVEKTGAEGLLLNEAKTINKSLSSLGIVINNLADGKASHVPYRDSKLTRVLQESLGGNSRTTLLCCCSPSSLNAAETLSTLRFGMRAKQIKNKPKVNAERGQHELEQLLQKAQQENHVIRQQLQKLRLENEKLSGQVYILTQKLSTEDGGDDDSAAAAAGNEVVSAKHTPEPVACDTAENLLLSVRSSAATGLEGPRAVNETHGAMAGSSVAVTVTDQDDGSSCLNPNRHGMQPKSLSDALALESELGTTPVVDDRKGVVGGATPIFQNQNAVMQWVLAKCIKAIKQRLAEEGVVLPRSELEMDETPVGKPDALGDFLRLLQSPCGGPSLPISPGRSKSGGAGSGSRGWQGSMEKVGEGKEFESSKESKKDGEGALLQMDNGNGQSTGSGCGDHSFAFTRMKRSLAFLDRNIDLLSKNLHFQLESRRSQVQPEGDSDGDLVGPKDGEWEYAEREYDRKRSSSAHDIQHVSRPRILKPVRGGTLAVAPEAQAHHDAGTVASCKSRIWSGIWAIWRRAPPKKKSAPRCPTDEGDSDFSLVKSISFLESFMANFEGSVHRV